MDDRGMRVGSGVYVVAMRAGERSATRKVVVVR